MRPRVVFVGLHPMWPTILASGLQARFADELSVSAFVQGAGISSIPGFFARLATADLIVRVGVTLNPGSILDRAFMTAPAWRRRPCCALFWIGSDVLRLLESQTASEQDARMAHALATLPSLAGADHLVTELASAGVAATAVPFPATVLAPPACAPELPRRFAILTYLSVGSGPRFEFYGGPQILKAAEALPDTRFMVMGVERIDGHRVPPNVELLGRLEDPSVAYGEASVVVRTVAHDAVGGTVMEGLLYGRHVVYTLPLKHTTTVPFGDTNALVEALEDLKARHDAGSLGLNNAGRDWAVEEFDPERRFAHLKDVLITLCSASRRSR
jgi:hypothetical protein